MVVKRSEEHTSELQSPCNLVCRLLLEKKQQNTRFVSRACIRHHRRQACRTSRCIEPPRCRNLGWIYAVGVLASVLALVFFFLGIGAPPNPTLFPHPTLFR